MKRAAMLVAAVAIAGCAGHRSGAPAITEGGVRCDANAAMALIGRPGAASEREAQRLSGAASIRRYVSGAPLTMDYRAERLDIETDAVGTIVRLRCG